MTEHRQLPVAFILRRSRTASDRDAVVLDALVEQFLPHLDMVRHCPSGAASRAFKRAAVEVISFYDPE